MKTDRNFPVPNRPFFTFDLPVSVFSGKYGNGSESGAGRKLSEPERKQGRCFSARIFGFPFFVGIFPDLFQILPDFNSGSSTTKYFRRPNNNGPSKPTAKALQPRPFGRPRRPPSRQAGRADTRQADPMRPSQGKKKA